MMKVVPLGTVSGKPTLTRAVSALAVVRETEWLLFDCGEGTQTRVMRAGLHSSRLSAIFITHLHGDHFNGLAGFLSTMGLDRRERALTLIGPPGIREYLEMLSRLKILFVNYPLQIRELGAAAFAETESERCAQAGETGNPGRDWLRREAYEAEDYVVSCLPLDHRVFAIGYRLEERPRPGRFDVTRALQLGVPEGPMFGRLQSGHDVRLTDGRIVHPSDVLGPARSGKKLAYCTDTRPCRAASELARDVDLLVHEATFTEDLAEQAQEFGHATAAQAATIARDAGAGRLLITHFSPRYSDVTALLNEALAIFPNTILAEELVALDV